MSTMMRLPSSKQLIEMQAVSVAGHHLEGLRPGDARRNQDTAAELRLPAQRLHHGNAAQTSEVHQQRAQEKDDVIRSKLRSRGWSADSAADSACG